MRSRVDRRAPIGPEARLLQLRRNLDQQIFAPVGGDELYADRQPRAVPIGHERASLLLCGLALRLGLARSLGPLLDPPFLALTASAVKMLAADPVLAGAAAALRSWQDLRALTEDETLSLHELACLYAGRELTRDEARALLSKH